MARKIKNKQRQKNHERAVCLKKFSKNVVYALYIVNKNFRRKPHFFNF